MLPAGKNRFPWHLQYPEFHLFISRRESWFGDTPNLLVSLNSHTLWQRWVAGSVDLVKERVRELGGVVKGVRPSRCDLAADYYIPGGLLEADLVRHRCPRHFKRQGISDGDRLETWYVGGATSPVRLRIYDKGREILRDGRKLWFLDVWNRESVEGVWRVEFQVRRDVLRRYRLNSMADLQSHLCGLWDYLTEDWFSLRELDNEHTTRRSVTPWWQHVQSLGLKFGDRKPLERRLVSQCADLRWYVSHIAGCLKTLAALRGKFALDEALLDLEALLRAKLHPAKFMEEVRIRCIKLGIPVPKV